MIFQLKVGDERDEVHVAAAFADAVDRALNVAGAGATAARALATARPASLCVWMPSIADVFDFASAATASATNSGSAPAVGVA